MPFARSRTFLDLEPGGFDLSTNEKPDGRDQLHFAMTVAVRLTMLEVDHANELAA